MSVSYVCSFQKKQEIKGKSLVWTTLKSQTGSDEKGSTSDSSLYSEDRVLQPENEKERGSGD